MKISNELIEKVRRVVFSELGYELPAVINVSNNWVTVIPKRAIPKSLMGMMAPMFETATVEVKLGFKESFSYDDEGIKVVVPDTAYVIYGYDYHHPDGGHDGYSHRFEVTL
jgi:hypothetical protein